MRKLFWATITTVVVLAACNPKENKSTDQTGADDQSEKNLASARIVSKAFQSGDANSIDSAVAEDFLDHTDQGDKIGRDSLKAMINQIHKAGRDMKMETIREVADNDFVFQWMRYTGTSDGSMGPAGPYDMKMIEVSKYKEGKIVEHWAYMDAVEMMKMMSQMPPMDNKMKMDSGKMNKSKMDTTKAKP